MQQLKTCHRIEFKSLRTYFRLKWWFSQWG